MASSGGVALASFGHPLPYQRLEVFVLNHNDSFRANIILVPHTIDMPAKGDRLVIDPEA